MSAAATAEARATPDQRDADELLAHITMIHDLAARVGKPGRLVVCRFGEDPVTGRKTSPLVRHFAIGDVAGMVRAVRDLGTGDNHNVYVPLALMRPDLPAGRKGEERDVVAVLGMVGDFDDAAAADYEARLPLAPNFVVQTSAGRFQTPYLFDPAPTVEEAKPVAKALKALAGCDHGTADLCHVWRVPGTLNWPTKRKVDAGRPREPQRVRAAEPWDGSLVTLAELREAIEAARPDDGAFDWDTGPEPEPEAEAPHGPNGQANDHAAGGAPDFTLFLMGLPDGPRRRIVEPTPEGERSENINFAVCALLERDMPLDRIEALIRAHPTGVGAKFVGRSDLRREIERIRDKWRARAGKAQAAPAPDPAAVDVAALARLEASDTGNADRLLARFGDDLLYATHAGWHAWDGRRWRRDDRQHAIALAQRTARGIFAECAHLADKEAQERRAKWAVISQNKGRVDGMLAMAVPHRAVAPEDLDADPWALNVANGTLDLRTGHLRPHRRTDHLTGLAPVVYDSAAPAPVWGRFLRDVFAGDDDVIRFLQRAVGYSLSGDTREQVLFLLHGRGSNGKSTLLKMLAAILGDFAQQTPADTFMVRERGGVPNDIARLKGARFVAAIEAEDGRRLADGLVKQATGGDRMAARFLHREWFEFTPQLKLWLAFNHKPVIRGTDHAIWRRIRLVPFEVRFWKPEDEDFARRPHGALLVDSALEDALRAELPGILAWAVRGCLEWREKGLSAPGKVLAATAAYRAEMDTIGDFIADCCLVGPAYSEGATQLYNAYAAWCQTSGHGAETQNKFGRALGERGLDKEKIGRVVYRGLTLKG